MPRRKTRSVEVLRCWAGNGHDSGTWDTYFVDVPADIPEDRLEEVARATMYELLSEEARADLVHVALYWEDDEDLGDEEDEGEAP
jgi:hypothetical protein